VPLFPECLALLGTRSAILPRVQHSGEDCLPRVPDFWHSGSTWHSGNIASPVVRRAMVVMVLWCRRHRLRIWMVAWRYMGTSSSKGRGRGSTGSATEDWDDSWMEYWKHFSYIVGILYRNRGPISGHQKQTREVTEGFCSRCIHVITRRHLSLAKKFLWYIIFLALHVGTYR
jgi:hypothetical protein